MSTPPFPVLVVNPCLSPINHERGNAQGPESSVLTSAGREIGKKSARGHQTCPQTLPVKARTGIGFAPWSNIAVPYNTVRVDTPVLSHQEPGDFGQFLVLAVGKAGVVSPLQFNSD